MSEGRGTEKKSDRQRHIETDGDRQRLTETRERMTETRQILIEIGRDCLRHAETDRDRQRLFETDRD